MIRIRTWALCATALTLMAPAQAQEAQGSGPKIELSGFVDAGGVAAPARAGGSGLTGNAELRLRGSVVLDDGLELGIRLAVRATDPDRSGSVSLARAGVTAEKAFIFAESGLGRLEIGATDGAAAALKVALPSAGKSFRLDDPQLMTVVGPDDFVYRPGGLMLRTDPYASEQAFKAVYRTPRLFGLQAAVSYTPRFNAGLKRYPSPRPGTPDELGEIWEAALNYDGNLDDWRVRASLSYLTGQNRSPEDIVSNAASPWVSADLVEWAAALELRSGGWRGGAAWRHSNARGGFAGISPVLLTGGFSDTEIFSAGTTYSFSDITLGAAYAHGTTQLARSDGITASTDRQTAEGFELAASYAFASDWRVTLGWQHYRFDAGAAFNPLELVSVAPAGLAGGGTIGDLNADTGFLEISFNY